MNHDEITGLLGAYSLDAVDADEARAIEDHLRECARCRAEVAEHRETAALLAHASGDAPADLWERIAESIDVPAPVTPLVPGLGSSRRRARWPAALALVGAAAAVVVGVLVVQVREQDERLDQLASALAAGSSDFAEAAGRPGARIVELASDDGVAVPVVVTADGQAWLQAAALPDLPDGRTYQLWGATGDDLVSVAVLGRDPGVVSFVVEGYAALAITEERAPGVVRSTNEPLVIGELA